MGPVHRGQQPQETTIDEDFRTQPAAGWRARLPVACHDVWIVDGLLNRAPSPIPTALSSTRCRWSRNLSLQVGESREFSVTAQPATTLEVVWNRAGAEVATTSAYQYDADHIGPDTVSVQANAG